MSWLTLVLLAVAMSTDAFAVAVARGAAMRHPTWRHAIRIGIIVGVIEGIAPLLGWLAGNVARQWMEQWDHWIAFALLAALGIHLIYESLTDDGSEDPADLAVEHPALRTLIVTGIATSLDAAAAGVSLAFVDVSIVTAAILMGISTVVLVTVGVMLGRIFGVLLGKRAELIGGIVLILIGASFVAEHYTHLAR